MITITENLDYLAFLLSICATASLGLEVWLKIKWLPKISLALTSISAIVMVITVFMRIQKTGSLPVNSVYEFTLFFCLILLAFTVFWLIKFKINLVAVFLLFIAMLLLGFSFGMSDSVTPLMPALQSNWRVSHVLTAIIAYSSFAIAFVLGLTYLISMPGKGKENQLIPEKQERGAFLEKTMYNSVVVGFIFLTLLIVTGSIWAQDAWGSWWSWDPKETWALITWIIYAIYLHLHSKPEWKGRKGCWLAVIGFVCVMFTLFGVTFLMGGLHSY